MVFRGRRTAPLATTIALSGWASLATDLQFIYGSLERSTPDRTFPVALPDTVALSLAHFATRCQERPHSSSPISPSAAKNGRTPLGPFPVTLPSRVTPPFPPTLAFIGRAVGVAGLYLSFNYECGRRSASGRDRRLSRLQLPISSNGRGPLADRQDALEEHQLRRPGLAIETRPPGNEKSRRNSCDRSFARLEPAKSQVSNVDRTRGRPQTTPWRLPIWQFGPRTIDSGPRRRQNRDQHASMRAEGNCMGMVR